MAKKKMSQEQWIKAARSLASIRQDVNEVFTAAAGVSRRSARLAADWRYVYLDLCYELRQRASANAPECYEEVFQILEASIIAENEKDHSGRKPSNEPPARND